ncbi:MAG: serine/threonine-protein kinase [Pseudomonadales bacterium]
MRDLTGTVIGNFVVGERLGRGGMGEVYKAVHRDNPGLIRAIKFMLLHPGDAGEYERRFRSEARRMAELSHRSVVRLDDFGVIDGIPYIVMEFVDGQSIKERLHVLGPYSLAEAIDVLIPVAEALGYLHNQVSTSDDARVLLHRDVKSENIMVDRRGAPRLMDLGIARFQQGGTRVTRPELAIGDRRYMPGEQALGEDLTPASDLYALGVVFYEMLTGTLPFTGKTDTEISLKHIKEPFPSLREKIPDLNEAVDEFIQQLTRKNPQERPQSAEEVVRALRLLKSTSSGSGGSGAASPPSDSSRDSSGGDELREKKPSAWMIGLASVVLLFGAGYWLWAANQPDEKPPKKQLQQRRLMTLSPQPGSD